MPDSLIHVREGEPRDYTLEAKHDGAWVQIMHWPHSLRVVNELIAWRNRHDHAHFKKTGVHLYAPYRGRKL